MKKKMIGLLLTVSLVISGLTACGSSETKSGDTTTSVEQSKNTTDDGENYKVAITWSSGGMEMIQNIVKANNLDEGLGLDITWIEGLNTGPEMIASIAGGSSNIAVFGDFPIVTNYGSGEKPVFKVIDTIDLATDSAIIVKADSDIQSLEELKGKSIGTQIGTGSQYQTDLSLEKGGLTEEDIQLVSLDSGSWVSALVDEQVDAVCILKSVTVGNEELGDIRILDEADYAVSSVIADTTWAEENPETAARVLVLFQRVLDFIQENEDTAIKNVSDAYPDVPEERIKFQLELMSGSLLDGVSDKAIDRYTELKDFALKVGTIQNDFNVEDVYTNEYANHAKEIASQVE